MSDQLNTDLLQKLNCLSDSVLQACSAKTATVYMYLITVHETCIVPILLWMCIHGSAIVKGLLCHDGSKNGMHPLGGRVS